MGTPGPEVLALPCASPAGDCSSLRPGHLFSPKEQRERPGLCREPRQKRSAVLRGDSGLRRLGRALSRQPAVDNVLIFADTGLRSQGTGLRASSTPPPGPPPHHSGASPERHPRLGAFGAAAAALGGRSGARESKVTLLPSTAGSGLFDAGIQRKSEVEG